MEKILRKIVTAIAVVLLSKPVHCPWASHIFAMAENVGAHHEP